MTIKQRLIEDMKTALKAHEAEKLSAIRYGLSEIKKVEIDQGELNDLEAAKILSKLIKQAEESIEQYQQGQREDLVKAEIYKIGIWRLYLPKPLTKEELQAIVDQSIKELDQPSFNQLMPLVMKKVAGRAGGQQVVELVKTALVLHAK